MEDIGDIIYILAMLAIGIVGIIRKNFKNQQTPPPKPANVDTTEEEDRDYDPFGDLRKYIVDDDPFTEEEKSEEAEPVIVQTKPVEVPDKIDAVEIHEKPIDSIWKIKGDSIIKDGFNKSHNIKSTAIGDAIKHSSITDGHENEGADFNLRRAIIYDAILNRPDY